MSNDSWQEKERHNAPEVRQRRRRPPLERSYQPDYSIEDDIQFYYDKHKKNRAIGFILALLVGWLGLIYSKSWTPC